MAISIPIGEVDFIRHLSIRGAFLEDPPDPSTIVSGFEGTVHTPDGEQHTTQVAMEVYTGWVLPGFVAGGSTDRQEARTFLPIAPNRIKAYPAGSLLGVTATASPATIGPEEDEAVIVGVDGVRKVAPDEGRRRNRGANDWG